MVKRAFAGNSLKYMAAIPLLAAFGLPAAGCNGEDGISSVRPKMVLRPEPGTELLFDEVVLTKTEVEPVIVEIENVGEGLLLPQSVVIEGEFADQFFVSSFPEVVQPGDVREIFVRFRPTIPGTHSAMLVIETNDPEQPRVTFPVTGPAREPCAISMGPTHQSFLLGEIRDVNITAVTSFECRIVRIFTDRSLFDIINEPELPHTIASGETLTLQVQHVGTTNQPGIPTRELRIKESEGTEQRVTFEGEPPVYGCLSVFPSRILFPNTEVGDTARGRVTVSNSCSVEAAISSANVSNGFYFYEVENPDEFPKTIAPLSDQEIFVIYKPFSPVGDPGKLNINTNDAANPRLSVELYGQARVPDIRSFPNGLDFGTVIFKNPQGVEQRSECSSRTRFVQVFSTGDADLVIDQLEIDSSGDAFFQIASVVVDEIPIPNFNQPITVPPEAEMRITLQFYPVRENPAEHRGKLLIHHNAESAIEEVVLIGNGAADGATTDMFTQLEGPKLDILWVIDNSCSMYDEQARLINNLSQFIGYADSQNADYQMAVTDTDSRSNGAGLFERCTGHPSVIGSDYRTTEIREEVFECMFDVGTNGGGFFEAGLGAAMRTFERALDPNNQDPNMNPQRKLLRDDAKLAIVVMSDEDDQSAETNEVLRDFYFSVKGSHRPDRVALHAIAGPTENPCATGPRGSAPGYRYAWMARETGGIFFDICQEDWSPVLQTLGLNVFTPTDEWDLTQVADPASLDVTVDGVAVPRDVNNGYVYNPAGNSVKFNGVSIPTPGAEIVVSYTGLCRP